MYPFQLKENVVLENRRALRVCITKTCLYRFDPLKLHFYTVKLEFTRVYVIFLITAQKHRLWYSLEPLCLVGSNEYPQSMFEHQYEKYSIFSSENFHFLVVKFSVYLNRHVYVMVRISCNC